jgi:RNA polymerase sigma-70 factor (ECF subfamily)
MERHGPSMLRTAWRVLGRYGKSDAEDVVQESFLAALTTTALPDGDVGAWLRAITVRKGLDALRKAGRRAEQPLPEGLDDTHDPRATEGDPAEALALRRALAAMNPIDRAVLILADVEGRSMAEVAEILGSTRVAVKLRASRARRRLARTLRPPDTD